MNETVTIEKQVWESTLHRSMVLQAENAQLKELLTMVKPVLQLEYNVTENRNLIKKIEEVLR